MSYLLHCRVILRVTISGRCCIYALVKRTMIASCNCFVSSYYMNKCWCFGTFRNRFKWNLNQNTMICIEENANAKVVSKIAAFSSQLKCVKSRILSPYINQALFGSYQQAAIARKAWQRQITTAYLTHIFIHSQINHNLETLCTIQAYFWGNLPVTGWLPLQYTDNATLTLLLDWTTYWRDSHVAGCLRLC